MRIGIDCRTMLNPAAGERAGVGHYTFHLVEALVKLDRRNEYVLYFDHRMPHEIASYFRGKHITIRWLPWSRYGRYLPFAYSHLLIGAAIARDRLDVFHATANVMPLTYPGPTVITLHDLAIYLHPEWFPPQRVSTRVLVPQSLRKAAHVIAVSEATMRDAQTRFAIPPDRISVVYEGADTTLLKLKDRQIDIRKTYQLSTPYLLYVGTLEPRKNIPGMIQAWQRMRAKVRINGQLVIAGGLGFRGEEILRLIKKLGPEAQVRYLGYIPHNHKVQLLRAATGFVFPSFYEGFGLPVLEAMQLGVPVITSPTSSLPEVTGSAASLVDPNNISGLATMMQQIMTKPALRAKLSQAGKKRAKLFSWSTAARQTLKVYQRVAQA